MRQDHVLVVLANRQEMNILAVYANSCHGACKSIGLWFRTLRKSVLAPYAGYSRGIGPEGRGGRPSFVILSVFEVYPLEVGIYIRDFLEDPNRPIYEQIEEAAEVCRRARSWGFSVIYLPQHFIAHPTVWLQPMQTLARLAPDAEGLKLLTGILLLTYFSPVDIAEQTATLDQISNGRFILGVGLGYREKELEAFATNRKG